VADFGETPAGLPTWPEIKTHAVSHLHAARNEMSEVRDWLNSDWRLAGQPLTSAEARARSEALRIVGQVKNLIDEAKGLLQREGISHG
jgi:hypothetical protein